MPTLESERPAPSARVHSQMPLPPQALAILEPLAEVIVGPAGNTDEWYAEVAMYDALIIGGNIAYDSLYMDRIGPRVRARYGDLVQHISFDTSAQLYPDRVAGVLAGLRR